MKLRLFCFLACFYLLIGSRAEPWADSKVMYEAAKALVDHRRLSLEIPGAEVFFVIRDGKRYPLNAPGNIAALVPSYLLYKRLARLPKAPAPLLNVLTSHLPSALLMAGVGALFFALARREGASRRGALLLSLLLGLGTIVLVYARVPYSEALQTLALLWLVERALRLGEELSIGGAALGGLAAGLLLSAKAVLVLALPGALAYVLYRQRHLPGRLVAALLAAAGPFLFCVGVNLLYNRLRTGAWLDSGYGSAGRIFSGNPREALVGFLYAPGAAVWIYSPPVLLGLMSFPGYLRRDPARGLLLLSTWLAVLLPLLGYHSWHGLWCWGPRYLVPLTPLLLLPAAPWISQPLRGGGRLLRVALVLLVSGAGVAVQALGAALHWDIFIRLAGHASGVEDRAVLFMPRYAPIRGHLWLLRHVLSGDGKWLSDGPWLPDPPHVYIGHLWPIVRLDWWVLEGLAAKGARPWVQGILAGLAAGLLWSAGGLLCRLLGQRARRKGIQQ